jgi:hypothetical protein
MVKRKNSEEGQSILGLGDLYRTFNISGDFLMFMYFGSGARTNLISHG